MLFDCQACGACCCNTQNNVTRQLRSYIEVLSSDLLFKQRPDLLGKLTVLDDFNVRQMRLVNEEQRCIALGGELGEKVTCEIYPLRPQGCRQVEPGDDECLKARKLHRPRLLERDET